MSRRTWFAELPILRPAPGNDRVSSIAVLGYDPRTQATELGFQLQRTYYNRYTIATFIEEMIADLNRDVLVILDN